MPTQRRRRRRRSRSRASGASAAGECRRCATHAGPSGQRADAVEQLAQSRDPRDSARESAAAALAECRQVDVVRLARPRRSRAARDSRLHACPTARACTARLARAASTHDLAIARRQRIVSALRHQQRFGRVRMIGSATSSARLRTAGWCGTCASCSPRLRSGASASPSRPRRTAAASGWRRARRSPGDEDVRGRHANLQAVQIGGLVHRARARCRTSASPRRRSPGRPARAARSLRSTAAPGLAVRGATHVLDGVEHVGQREESRQRKRIVQRREVHARDVERAEARQVDRVGFAAQLARVIDANSQATVGLLLRCARPIQRTACTVG